MPIFKEEVKKHVLQQHLIWTSWCLIMTAPNLKNKEGELLETESLIDEALSKSTNFYFNYARTRFDLYFEHRELFAFEKTNLK